MEKSLIIIIIQIVIIFIIIGIITFIIMLDNAIRLEKRISKYTIKSNNHKKDISIYDNLKNKYFKFIKKQRKKMSKLFPNLSKRYDKYITDGETRAVDYITHKMVICFIFVVITIISSAIRGKLVTIFQIFISIILGFYILDIILIIYNKFNKRKIENDMFQAVIILNNAFKSGASTIQAVEIASKKLPKPICNEFKRIHQELKYGLSLDVAFDRFARRVNIEEASYLSSSLTILNKTGGNIVAVFNSIEKTLFDKKKLKDELKNSTAVSNLVVKILLLIPIIFILIIYILNPSYFNPFFESTYGLLLLGISIIMFIIYANLLKRIVKVN